jgi:hypothetical protein
MSDVSLFSEQNNNSSEEILSPLEMKRVISLLKAENATLKEKLEMLTDIIAPLLGQKQSNELDKKKITLTE